jgi:hypothetical protein
VANALEATGEDPPGLVRHLEAAGELERAAQHAVRAARRASEALAFELAARLYATALRLVPYERSEARRLQIEEAEALASAGCNIESAGLFQAACQDAPDDENLELSRRAAEQLLRSGHVDDGMAIIRTVFARLHMYLPSTRMGTLWSIATARTRLGLRGPGYKRRTVDEIPAVELARIDTYYSANIGLGVYHFLLAADCATRHLLCALDAGEPSRIAVALAHEAAFSAARGGRSRAKTARSYEAARALADEVGDPHAIGTAAVAGAICALLEGRWRETVVLAQQADATFRERCRGALWEIANAQTVLVSGLGYLGSLKEVAQRVPRLVREADERGDLTARTFLCTGEANLSWLVRDEVQGARHAVEHASRQYSQHAATVQQYSVPLSRARIELYAERGGHAHALITDAWPALEKSLLLHVQFFRVVMLNLRASAALARASELHPRERRDLLGQATRDARRIARENMPYAKTLAALLVAGIAAGRSDLEGAIAHYQTAASEAHAADMSLYAAAARWRKGELQGGEEGKALCQQALAAFAAQAAQAPTRMAALLVPRMVR